MTEATAGTREELVLAALAGDEDAFRSLTEPYVRELHVHCYRMTGSLHDADDALQETLLRAWRHLGGFAGRSTLRAWLYRIATNVSLTAVERAGRGPAVTDLEAGTLEPYPDALLEELPAGADDPAGRYDLHESVQLAFLAALQLLPARQRAVLLLRDVLGWSGPEVSELLGTTLASVNSALQRARATLARRRHEGLLRLDRAATPNEVEQAVLARFMAAWEAVDLDGLVALLREDALMTMPPVPLVYRGPDAIVKFFRTVPASGRLDEIPLVPVRANRQPAFAAYVRDPATGVQAAYGVMVLTLDGDGVGEITGFADAALLARFGLPPTLPA